MDASAPVFKRFDFGARENLERYGEMTPPDYNLKLVKGIPIRALIGKNDNFSNLVDDQRLYMQLRSYGADYK